MTTLNNHIEDFFLIHFDIIKKFNINLTRKGNFKTMNNHIEDFFLIHFDIIKKFNINLTRKGNVVGLEKIKMSAVGILTCLHQLVHVTLYQINKLPYQIHGISY